MPTEEEKGGTRSDQRTEETKEEGRNNLNIIIDNVELGQVVTHPSVHAHASPTQAQKGEHLPTINR